MKNLTAATALAAGMLLLLVPRFILPACEYEGYPAMHCSDTARAEYLAGALLIVLGGVTFFLRPGRAVALSAVSGVVLLAVSFWLPDKFGYCSSPRMPCHYGMVPGVRFIAVLASIVLLVAAIGSVRKSVRKGNA